MAEFLTPEQLSEVLGIVIERLDLHCGCRKRAVQADIGDKVGAALQSLCSKYTALDLSELGRSDDSVGLRLTAIPNRLAREDLMNLPGAIGLQVALVGN